MGSRILRKGSPTIRGCESSRDQLLGGPGRPPRPSSQGRRLTRLQGFSPRRATSPVPLGKIPATGRSGLGRPGRRGRPLEARWRPPLSPSFPKNPLLVPRRETRMSWRRRRDPGNSARPAAPPGPRGGDFTSPGAETGGGVAREAVQPAPQRAEGGRQQARSLRPLFSSPGPHILLSARGQEVASPQTPPRSQRPGSDLRLLLQSGQQEGGSPESGASRALLRRLLPPRLHRLLSDSSFCCSRRGASRTTRAEHSPAGASSAAASGARGAVDRLAVQVSYARPGCPGRGWGRRGGGGGVSGRRRAEAQAPGPDAEIAPPAFSPGTSCGTSPGWNPGRRVHRCASE